MSENLKPCPFCNSDDVGLREVSNSKMYAVLCECDAEGPWAFDRELAAQHWNKRPDTTRPERSL